MAFALCALCVSVVISLPLNSSPKLTAASSTIRHTGQGPSGRGAGNEFQRAWEMRQILRGAAEVAGDRQYFRILEVR